MSSVIPRLPRTMRWSLAVALGVTAACQGDAAGPAPGPVSAAQSVVSVSRGVLVAGTLAELTLEARDAAGSRVPTGGSDVVFVASGGTSAGIVSAATDVGNGTYTATFTGTTAGTPTTIGATVDGEPVTQPLPTIEVVPGPISPITSYVTVSPRTIVTGGQATLTLVTADAMGNELGAGGRTVQFAAAGGTSTGTIGPVSDPGTGRYTATFTGTGVGTPLTVGATVDGVPVAPPLPTLTVAYGVSADSSLLTASSDTVTLHASVVVTLRVRDSAGVARQSGGEDVAFFVVPGGAGSGLGTIDSTTDHDDGSYTATFTATVAGDAVTIGATLNGDPVGGAVPGVTVLPIAIAPQNSSVLVSPDAIAAGASATLTLEVFDVDSNRVTTGGLAVAFTLGDDGTSGGTIGPTTDHDDGSYSASFIGTVAGTPVTVGATINDSTRVQMLDSLGISQLPTITVQPGAPAPDSSVVSASPPHIELGDSATLLLETRDAYGNLLGAGGRSVEFTRAGGFGVSVGRIGPVTDHGDGTYSARYLSDTAGRPDTIHTSVDGVPLTSLRPTITVTCTATSVSPALSEVTVNDTTVLRAPVKDVTLQSGVSSTVTLWARDARACPVLVPVAVVLGTSGGTSGGTLGAVVDQGDGTHIASLTGTTAGTATTIVATVDGMPVTSSPATVTVVPGDISAQTSLISTSRPAVDSGARAIVTLAARDAAGNDLTHGGRVVTFAIVGGHGTIGPTTDHGDGRYTAEYTGQTVAPGDPDSITVRIEGTPVRTPSPAIAVVAGTISPAQSSVTVSASSVAAGDSVLVTLTGRDAAGRALVTGDRPEAIVFTQAGSSEGVFQPLVNPDDGTYEAYFSGRVAGGATEIGATIEGAPVTTALPSVTVTAGPAAAGTSRVSAAADSLGVADTTTVELAVFDAFDNPVSDPGLAVVFVVAPDTVGSVSAAVYVGGNRYAAVLTGLATGTALVGASIDGVMVTTAPAAVRVE